MMNNELEEDNNNIEYPVNTTETNNVNRKKN